MKENTVFLGKCPEFQSLRIEAGKLMKNVYKQHTIRYERLFQLYNKPFESEQKSEAYPLNNP